MTIITKDSNAVLETTPIHLRFHVVAMLNVTARDARHRVNRQVVAELGTGLVARDPEMVIGDEFIAWRVPIVLSLPELGDLGRVGAIDVDAETGDVSTRLRTDGAGGVGECCCMTRHWMMGLSGWQSQRLC